MRIIILCFFLSSCGYFKNLYKKKEINYTILLEKDQIKETINKLYMATDSRDWEGLKRLFNDKVHFDMKSLTGVHPSSETPDSIAYAWEKGLEDVPVVHHQSGNYVIDVDEDNLTAKVKNYGMAVHHYPNRKTVWFVGSYDWELIKEGDEWIVTLIRFNKKYVHQTK